MLITTTTTTTANTHKLKRMRLLASRNFRKIHRNRIIFIVAFIFSSHRPLLLCVFQSHVRLFSFLSQNRTNVACCVIVCVWPAPFTFSIPPYPPPSLCLSQVIYLYCSLCLLSLSISICIKFHILSSPNISFFLLSHFTSHPQGTSERVCLISGTVDGILTVLDFIIDKIREKPDMTKALTEADAKQAAERDKQVKVLVPNSTAGMIIGKAGAFIKQIKEDSGSYVQISQKPKELTLQERCITIIGEKENNKIACKMILSKIVEDPSSGSCLNVSYADINGPVANFNPTGSPFAASQNPTFSSSTASLNSALGGAMPGASAAGLLVNGTGLNLSLNLGAPSPQTNPTVTTQLLEHIKVEVSFRYFLYILSIFFSFFTTKPLSLPLSVKTKQTKDSLFDNPLFASPSPSGTFSLSLSISFYTATQLTPVTRAVIVLCRRTDKS